MKRIPIYIILIALVFFAPVDRVDVGTLQPVEIIELYYDKDAVVVKTDTGDIGKGENVQTALADLKETAPGVIYLDTAEFLLVEKGSEIETEVLRDHLKGSIRVCYIQEEIDLKSAAKYLRAHGAFPKLKEWKSGDILPVLTSEKIL